jgi:hypothetical protein
MTARMLDIDGFVAAAHGLPDELELLVAKGGFGVEKHDRIGLVTVEDAPRVLEDAYLPSRDLDELVRRLAHARPRARARRGGWNTMHATAWSFAWSDDAGPLVLLDARGRLAWVDGDRLHTRGGAPIERLAIAAVEPYVENGWVTRGVRVRLRDGAIRAIAREDDEISRLDPTYDGLNLMADTAWTHELARALSRGLGPPVVDCIS